MQHIFKIEKKEWDGAWVRAGYRFEDQTRFGDPEFYPGETVEQVVKAVQDRLGSDYQLVTD